MSNFISTQKQIKELKRGVEEVLIEKEFEAKLEKSVQTKTPLRIKAGFDPTAPDLHLGHTVLLQKMAQFQEFGHEVIFLIGDFTGLVGDPTGKSKTRPQLTTEEIKRNAETYQKQVSKILDPNKTILKFNSEWLSPLHAMNFVRLASHINVARMLEREDFARRFKENQPISLHEFLYPLLQAYDSVVLKADIELGGTDQKFNLLLGRELMRDFGLEPQVCLLVPLLEGLDGVNKMSKSLQNAVGILEPPKEIYGKLMSLPDTLLRRYYELLSPLSLDEIEEIFTKEKAGQLHPKEIKSQFAVDIVKKYYNEEQAKNAKEEFERIFSRKEIPQELKIFSFELRKEEQEIWIPKLLSELKFVASTSEGKRLVSQKAVKINEKTLETENFSLSIENSFVLQCGKRKFAKVVIIRK